MKDYDYFVEHDLPLNQYYDQFETARKLEVGKVYYRHSGIYWEHFKIVFIGEGVALGIEVSNGNNNFSLGKKVLFHAEGNKAGWVYQDGRSVYRLRKEV